MSTLTDIASATASRYNMLPGGSVVLAMVSGGADSMSLLRLLASGALGELRDLAVLHVNHGLRGSDSDGDEEFVARACAGLGVRCRVVRYNVAEYAEADGLNLEDAGRRVRYRFADSELDSMCAALGVSPLRGRIAVAHTFDDRLETFLARMVAGAGSGGLRSIAPVRGRIVRPLLDARRADVVEYLQSLGQSWREDATNADTSRQRAWVRHDLLPVIEARNPAFGAVAARMLTVLSEEDDMLAEMAGAFAHDFAQVEDGALLFNRGMMATLTRPMARRVVRDALTRQFPDASRIEFEHVEAVVDGLADDAFARDLPFGLRAATEYDKLRISRSDDFGGSVAPGLLSLPGTLDLGPAGSIEAAHAAPGVVLSEADAVSLDADSVSWPLVVDSVREGDRMQPFGMKGTRKVSDLLIDAKVPKRMRAAIPVVRDGDSIVWLAGVRLAEDCRITDATRGVATLVWRRPDAGNSPLSG